MAFRGAVAGKGKGADISKGKCKGAGFSAGKGVSAVLGNRQDKDFWTRGSGKRFQQVLAFPAVPFDDTWGFGAGTDTYWSQCWFGTRTLMDWWHTPQPVCSQRPGSSLETSYTQRS